MKPELINEECMISEERYGFKVDLMHHYISDHDLETVEGITKKLSTEFYQRMVEELTKAK